MKFGPVVNQEITFEYNDFPPNRVQQIWLNEWLKNARLEFNVKVDNFAKSDTAIKNLVDLHAESTAVSH